MAVALPTACVSRCVPPAPGLMPSPVSGWPNFAVSDATTRSQATAAEAEPRDGRDERRPELANRVPALDPPLVVEVDRRRLGELPDVRAGGKCAFRPRKDDAANAVLAVELLEPLDELRHEVVGERVELLRPVELDDGDGLVTLDQNE